MRALLRLNMARVLNEAPMLVMAFVMLVAAVLGAAFISSRSDFRATIAVIAPAGSRVTSSQYLRVTRVTHTPPKSQLALGRYDAFVTPAGPGKFHVESMKNSTFTKSLTGLLAGQATAPLGASERRGPGTRILGFMVMFLLIQGVALMFPYASDKELKSLARIVASPLPISKYLLGQCVSGFVLLWVPSVAVVALVKAATHFATGFTLPQYAWLLAVFCILSVSLALLVHAVSESRDNGSMLGAWIAILTTILAGGFSAATTQGGLIGFLARAMPQRAYLAYAQGYESTGQMGGHLTSLAYVLVFAAVCFGLAAAKTKHDYVAARA